MLPIRVLNRVLKKMVRDSFSDFDDLPALRIHFGDQDSKFSFMDRFHRMQREDTQISEIPVQWVRVKKSRPDHILLYLHGGAFFMKTPTLHGQLLARICNRVGFTGLMPDYRLAPEYTFPKPLDDCLASYIWLLDNGYDPSRIVIGGDSAGGSLTMGLLMEIKSHQLPMPQCAFMLSPALRLSPEEETPETDSRIENIEKDVVLPTDAIRKFQDALVPNGDFSHPIFNLHQADFNGLPPLHFQTGTTEILRDDSVIAAKMAEETGIMTELIIWPDHPHVFMIFPFAQNSLKPIRMIAKFINSHVG